MVVHGSADPVFSVADTVNWYKALSARYKRRTRSFARLIIVPGMGHSRGGPACDQYDLVDALVKWVEQGISPESITAKARPDNAEVPASWGPERTRPLCGYPAVAVYNGSGDPEDAANWSCKMPK
jgi:feruloyl esterase